MFKRVPLSLQPFLDEFRAACVDLMLKLPASTSQIDRQIIQILTARRRLAKLQLQIQRYLIKEMPPQMRQQLHTLLHSTRDFLQLADSLIFLCEEYPLDPEGSIACLQRLNRRKAALLTQIERSLSTIDAGAAKRS